MRSSPLLPGEGVRRQHESSWCRRHGARTRVEVLIMEAAASLGHHALGSATVVDDPGHHLGEIRAIREERRALDDLSSGLVRSRQACHQCADRFVLHPTQATPITVAGP
jgi:hypothetical protein